MKIVAKLSILLFTIFCISSMAYAQDRPDEGSIGLSASIQHSQTNLQIPIWLTDNVTIAPVFGLYHLDIYTNLNVGITSRFFQDMGSDFGSYIGARGILQHTSDGANVNDGTDILLGATGGGEYFLDDHFSVGVEGQLNLNIDEGGNLLSTGAAVIGTYYF